MNAEANGSTPERPMSVVFGYSDSDDRMWLRIGDGPLLWWITRRLALRMIGQWAALVERTLPAEAAAGASAAQPASADRAARAALEHRGALAPSAAPAGSAAAEPPAPPGASALLFGVEIAVKGEKMRFVLRSAGNRQAFETPRGDAHRLLAAFVSRCKRNGWLESPLPEWLR
jgi:hypothetical protein